MNNLLTLVCVFFIQFSFNQNSSTFREGASAIELFFLFKIRVRTLDGTAGGKQLMKYYGSWIWVYSVIANVSSDICKKKRHVVIDWRDREVLHDR